NSNYGDKIVDLAAPGADIIGPYPEKSYSYLSGSSVAVPFVAGVAGQVYSNSKKELSSLELKKILIMSVKKINVLKGKVKTAGIVNYKKSMKIINAK
ncbi:MAG: S8 family serine peptidase, partial [Eubacterium sp.]|nr:S8 family serine peptidase [Eubacterium sp.]